MGQENYYYGQFGDEHLNAIKPGILLFNDQAYYECHESLEDLWLSDVGDKARYVYWAIIQVAASMIHYREDNLIGTQGMIKKAKEKLTKCEEFKVETALLEKYLDWHNFKCLIRSVDNNAKIDCFEPIFKYKFPNPNEWRTE